MNAFDGSGRRGWFARCLKWAVFAAAVAAPLAAESAESVEALLQAGRHQAAEESLTKRLQDAPDDPLANTQLGVVKVVQAIERLGQSNYRMGIGSQRQWALFFRMPVPPNDDPQQVTYQDVRDVLQQSLDDLAEAEAILARVGDREVKWPVDLAGVKIDLNGDGQFDNKETLSRVYLSLARAGRGAEAPPGFVVGLDTADVYWLRGYCHLLSALGEFLLAYDQQRMFDHTAHLIFPKAAIEHDFLFESEKTQGLWDWRLVADAVALVHLIDWPLKEPERLQSVHTHLLAVIETSRATWDAIAKETDNDREWIPGPEQQSVMPGGVMGQERIDAWRGFLDEAQALLAGEKLAPFWRDASLGVNLKRAFYEPRGFDLVLWLQGTAAAPYLEEGEVSEQETWEMLQRVFRGDFIGFAFWLN